MFPLVEAFLIIAILAGGILCWFGYSVYCMPVQLGRQAFVLFTVILGVGCLVTGILGLSPVTVRFDIQQSIWPQMPLWFWLFATLPWFIFVLQYTGIRSKIHRRTIVFLSVPYLYILLEIGLSPSGVSNAFFGALGSVVLVYTVSLVAGGTYLLLQTVYSAGHLPLGHGVSISVGIIAPFAVWSLMGPPNQLTTTDRAGIFATGAVFAALAVGTALVRYDLFESTPSIGTLGEQALIEQTEDLMFVVNGDERIITLNKTAIETLDVTRSDALGNMLSTVLEHDTEKLSESVTVTIQTVRGTRQYDPQVSTVTDPYGTVLGMILSLRDITEREIREQRLAVLNRVLRHNLRNKADVIKGNAESFTTEDERVETIINAADSIADYGQQARRIEQYVSQSSDPERVDLTQTIQNALDTVDADEADVSISVESPTSAQLVTNKQALVSAVESAIDNAITYADSTVTVTIEGHPDGFIITINDDGPGIPEWELDSLDAGSETELQHSTGVGLWQLKWAVMTLNGELSFDTVDGTTVEIIVPDRSRENVTAT